MKLYTLRDLLQIKNGKDHKHLANGDIPIFGSGGVMRFGDKAIYENDSILLPRKGTLSNIQFVSKPFWTVDTLYYTVVNTKLANPFYLYNLLKTLDLSSLNSGTGVPSMTFDAYYDLKISLPDINTQSEIASVLSALDAKIELNNSINAELEAMAKTIYDYWFVQFDFPDKNGLPYKSNGGKMVWNEELKRKVPEEWEVCKIEKFAMFKNGKGLHDSLFEKDGRYNIFGSNGIVGKTNQPLFNDPVIAIGRVGANYGEINYSLQPSWISDNAVTCQPIKKEYLWWLILSLRGINYKAIAGGSAQPLITQGKLREIKFIVPNDLIFVKYHRLIDSLYLQVENNNLQCLKLAELRDWLLPMLMNGQVSVGKAYEQVEEVLGMVAEDGEGYEK